MLDDLKPLGRTVCPWCSAPLGAQRRLVPAVQLTRVSFHCWLVELRQVAWVSCVPLAVEAPGTSRQRPLAAEAILQLPLDPAVNLHCWLAAV